MRAEAVAEFRAAAAEALAEGLHLQDTTRLQTATALRAYAAELEWVRQESWNRRWQRLFGAPSVEPRLKLRVVPCEDPTPTSTDSSGPWLG